MWQLAVSTSVESDGSVEIEELSSLPLNSQEVGNVLVC